MAGTSKRWRTICSRRLAKGCEHLRPVPVSGFYGIIMDILVALCSVSIEPYSVRGGSGE